MNKQTYVVYKFPDVSYTYPMNEVNYQGDFLQMTHNGFLENWRFNFEANKARAESNRNFDELISIEIYHG